jgi:hypothetical protein
VYSAVAIERIKTRFIQPRKSIYVVVGHQKVNDRVHKIIDLAMEKSSMVLVTPAASGTTCEEIVVNPYPNPTAFLRWLKLPKIKRAIDRWLFFPSTKILYVKAAQKVLSSRIRADVMRGIRVVLLTCVPSHDLCILGLSLKKDFPGIYWIVDWQDLWSYDENYFESTPGPYRASLLRLERRVHESCDLNITTNSYAKGVLEERYGVPCDRVVAIPHHFSRDDLMGGGNEDSGSRESNKQDIVRIGFLGTLFKPPRVPGAIVYEALRDINKSGVHVELHVHGNFPKYATKASLTRMRKNGLWFHGPSTHQESVQRLLQYDFLLLLLADLPNSRAVMSIKLPHYLLIGAPIIAVVPEPSAVADMIRETGTGYVIPISSDWQARLREILCAGAKSSLLQRNEDAINAYSWSCLSHRWMKVLNASGKDYEEY